MLLDLIGAILLGFGAAIAIGAFVFGLGSTPRAKFRTAGILIAWFAIVIALGATGTLHAAPTAPADVRGAALARFGLAVGLPLIGIVAAVLSNRSLRERVINMPTALLVGVNGIRVLGLLFILLYAQNRLPAPFAPIAGWGDILVGVLAVPLALATLRGENRALLLSWNALGMADLITAVGLAISAPVSPSEVGTAGMTLLPWLLIPGYLVPLLMTTHLAIFYKALRTNVAPRRTAFA